jgi:hypothetical protein
MLMHLKDWMICSEFLTKECVLWVRGFKICCRNPTREQHSEPMELTVGVKGMFDLCIHLVKTRMDRILWILDTESVAHHVNADRPLRVHLWEHQHNLKHKFTLGISNFSCTSACEVQFIFCWFLSKQFKIFILCHHMILGLCSDVFDNCMYITKPLKVFNHSSQSFICLSVHPPVTHVFWEEVHYFCKILAVIQCLWTFFYMLVTYFNRYKSDQCYHHKLHLTEGNISKWL